MWELIYLVDPSVEYMISSTAIDINTNRPVLYMDKFDYNCDVIWFSVVWRETSKFNGAIVIIVKLVKLLNRLILLINII